MAAAGCTLVHCPGCHQFFGRDPFPLERYQSAGVRLALGTDSWASNETLDMRREMRLARETLDLDAAAVWRMGTEHPAALIPDETVTGTIEEGSSADLVAFQSPNGGRALDQDAAVALEELTRSELACRKVWVGGVGLDLNSL